LRRAGVKLLLFLLVVSGAPRIAVAVPAEAAASTKKSSGRAFRYPQRTPSRERMKQIQMALKERGYDPGPIDGMWGSKSSAALKRFEKDNKLPADGKLDSLALITLGLGPDRAPVAAARTSP